MAAGLDYQEVQEEGGGFLEQWPWPPCAVTAAQPLPWPFCLPVASTAGAASAASVLTPKGARPGQTPGLGLLLARREDCQTEDRSGGRKAGNREGSGLREGLRGRHLLRVRPHVSPGHACPHPLLEAGWREGSSLPQPNPELGGGGHASSSPGRQLAAGRGKACTSAGRP